MELVDYLIESAPEIVASIKELQDDYMKIGDEVKIRLCVDVIENEDSDMVEYDVDAYDFEYEILLDDAEPGDRDWTCTAISTVKKDSDIDDLVCDLFEQIGNRAPSDA